LPPKDEVHFALDAFQAAHHAAQDGLAGIIAGLAQVQIELAGRLDLTQDKLDEYCSDLEKVFKRLQQLEAREKNLVDTRDARLQGQLQHLEQASLASRMRQDELQEGMQQLQGEVTEQQRRFEEVLVRKQEEPERTGRSSGSEEVQSISNDQIELRVKQVDLKVTSMMNKHKNSIQELMERLDHNLTERLKDVDLARTDEKQKMEACFKSVRAAERVNHRQAAELKTVINVLEFQGFLAQMEEKTERLPLLQRVEYLEDHFAASKQQVDDRLERLRQGVEAEEDAKLSMRLTLLSESHEVLSRDCRGVSENVKHSLEELSSLPKEVSQLADELKTLNGRQERTDADVSRLVRLGRILDDKVEVFDSMERRMEEFNANAQKLMGAQFASSVRCLSCADLAGVEASQNRGRSPSPSPRTSVVNHQFQALGDTSPSPPAGWSRPSSAKRPQSAGVRRSCEQISQQAEAQEEPNGPVEKRQQAMLVLTVPRVRTEVFAGPKPGSIGTVCGTAISAVRGEARAPSKSTSQPGSRPMSARTRMQISAHQERLAGC